MKFLTTQQKDDKKGKEWKMRLHQEVQQATNKTNREAGPGQQGTTNGAQNDVRRAGGHRCPDADTEKETYPEHFSRNKQKKILLETEIRALRGRGGEPGCSRSCLVPAAPANGCPCILDHTIMIQKIEPAHTPDKSLVKKDTATGAVQGTSVRRHSKQKTNRMVESRDRAVCSLQSRKGTFKLNEAKGHVFKRHVKEDPFSVFLIIHEQRKRERLRH